MPSAPLSVQDCLGCWQVVSTRAIWQLSSYCYAPLNAAVHTSCRALEAFTRSPARANCDETTLSLEVQVREAVWAQFSCRHSLPSFLLLFQA